MNLSQPLSSLVLFMKNGTTQVQNQDGRGLPVTRIETISNGYIDSKRVRFVELDSKNIDNWRIQHGDILLSHINSAEHIGKSAIYSGFPECLIHGMNLLLLRPDKRLVIPEYLHFGLRSSQVRERIRARCKRAINQASINQKELGVIELPVPPLEEQRRIVDLLSRAESIVRLRREAEKKVAELIPALFIEMFGDPASNPKGWPVKFLGDFVSIVGGSSLPQGIPFAEQSDGLMLLKVGDMNLQGNEVNFVKSKEWVPEQLKTYSRVSENTIIFPKRGAAIATNKKRITTRPALLDPNLMGVKPNEDETLTSYLFQWFSAFDLSDIASGTTVMQLNKVDLKPLRVPIPPIKLQREFHKKRENILDIQTQQSIATTKAQATFDALLAQVFGG